MTDRKKKEHPNGITDDVFSMAEHRREEPVKKITIDVLKPHKPDIVAFGKAICAEKSVIGLSISVYAVDEKTESVKIILEGPNVDFDRVKEVISHFGAVIHSIDYIIIGKKEIIV